jgi:hypothetical protein
MNIALATISSTVWGFAKRRGTFTLDSFGSIGLAFAGTDSDAMHIPPSVLREPSHTP